MKKNIARGIIALIAVNSIIFFNACSKKDSFTNDRNKTETEILTFASVEEYNKALNSVLSFNSEELRVWEESRGIKSFGRECDELYSKIDPEKFKSAEEVKAYVASNSDYFQLIEDNNGELILETKLFKSPNRYFINKDKMFQINETVYKVLNNGLASAKINHMDKLRVLDEMSISSFINDPDISLANFDDLVSPKLKDAAYNCGTAADDYESSGNNRTHMWLSIGYYDFYDINNVPMTALKTSILIRPYKRTLGIWYWCTRTVSCDLKVAVDTQTTTGWARNFYSYKNSGTSTSKIERVIAEGIISIGFFARYNMHFGGYDCWADTPSSPTVNLECNKTLF